MRGARPVKSKKATPRAKPVPPLWGVAVGGPMSPHDDDRVWARVDRSMAPPQRDYARTCQGCPPRRSANCGGILRHRLELHGTNFRRQVQIGPNIADPADHHLKLIVEIRHEARVAARR